MNSRAVIDDLSSFWMPFTANRQFKAAPRLLERAKGMYYRTTDGREILDGTAGLWCVNAGHCRDEDRRSDRSSRLATLDFAPTFQMGHPLGVRAPRDWSRIDAGRARPHLLHELGLGVGRYGAEDRARLSPRARRRPAHAPDRPRARLSRRGFRRHFGRRHRAEPQDVFGRAAARRRSPAAHARPRTQRVLEAASPAWGAISPTSWSASSRCTMPRRSPP